MFEISIANFKIITGTELEHFTSHVLRGDAWGSFLKLASTIEAASKRAIGIKLGIDPSLEAVARMEFYTALLLCRETELIPPSAFDFANYIRHVRNDLVHNGGMLNLDIEKLRGSAFFAKYKSRVEAFITIEGMSVVSSEQQHMNTLLVGCVGFISFLSKALFNDDWYKPNAAGSAAPEAKTQ